MSDSTLSFSDYQKYQKAEDSLHRLLNDEANDEKVMKSPRKQSVDNILAYSKALSIRKSDSVDYIENLLN
ncbi:MAG: hypothetical protein CMP59_11475 [Flavobacteriales bacterium]|nr:hypothetical protein [Flavobacteriales bacterium]|tara:strand:+ start:1008 stop:1217 length:210 start_codon:yes stop_codon:yes gene_type:complete